jgi:AcrR family transcriptional regulator
MSTDAPSTPPRRTRLTRDRVLQAAVALADAEGPQALSMRRLGRSLGVEAMSLYNHVAGKDDLLDGIVQYVLGEMDVPAPGEEWREAIRKRARSAREVFARHPWAMGLLESRSEHSSPLRLEYYDSVLGSLREAGFDPATAIRAFTIVDAFIFGFILQELSLSFGTAEELDEVGTDLLRQLAGSYPYLAEATTFAMESGYDRTGEFGFGLDLIIGGLERILAGPSG